MSYTATNNPTKTMSCDAIDSYAVWAIGPANFLNLNSPAPNLFCFQTSKTPNTSTQVIVLNGSNPPLYQTQIYPSATTLLNNQPDGSHNDLTSGLFSFGFGPRMDLLLIKTSGTKSGYVEVFVLYGAPYVSGTPYDAYLTCVDTTSDPKYAGPYPVPQLPPSGFVTNIPLSDAANYVFRVGDYQGKGTNDLYCIKTTNTNSKDGNGLPIVEVSVLPGWSLALASSGNGFYNTPLMNPTPINVPTTASEGDTTNANDYHWIASTLNSPTGALLYGVKVRNLSQPNNPGHATEIYSVNFVNAKVPVPLTFIDFLPNEDEKFYDAEYVHPNFHWMMNPDYGFYGVNTFNEDNPDINHVEVWQFTPPQNQDNGSKTENKA